MRIFIVFLISVGCAIGQDQTTELIVPDSTSPPVPKVVTIVVICEMEMVEDINEWLTTFFNGKKISYPNVDFNRIIFKMNRMELNLLFENMCEILLNGLSIIIDVTITGWQPIKQIASERGVPYLQIRTTNFEFVSSSLEYITAKYGKDLAMVFQNGKGICTIISKRKIC